MSQGLISSEQIRSAMAGLEAQRALLGDAVVEPALYALRQQLATLEDHAPTLNLAQDRRLVTIFFSDVVGSVTIAEQLDPEDWRQMIALVQSTIGQIVAEQHGTIIQYQGDALVALFGADDISEDDAENAVRAGLAAQQAIAQIELLRPVQIRIGIHTGLVVLGEWGADTKIEIGAFGDAINIAARLQATATPGSVLISRDTYRHVRGVFDLAAQPPLILKGRREPTQTYLALRARPRPFRTVNRGIIGLTTRTVGRDAELTQLQRTYLHAYGLGSVVWVQIIGEAGIGKSRLVADMEDWIELREESTRYFRARALVGDARQPLSLIRRLWFDRFGIAEDEPLVQAEAKWVQGFQELAQNDEIEPAQALGLLVGLPFKDSPYLGALRDDPAQVKGRAIVVTRALFSAIRAEMPILILLEDLHWSDSSSVEYLLQSLVGGDTHGHGVFVLATARPEWRPPGEFNPPAEADAGAALDTQRIHTGVQYLHITLTPLSDEASRELALTLLQRVEHVPDSLVQTIVERSEGVPYYAEEMINLMIDRDVIDQTREPWRFAPEKLDATQLPPTLHHLLSTRLLALSLEQRICLQRGAIFGRDFWEGGLQTLGVAHPRAILQQLQARGFVAAHPSSAFEGEHEWSFHHSLLRDVTYESVLKRERKALHKAAGDWLENEARQAGRLDEFVDRLAAHAEAAGERDAAADWYLRAGEHASARGAAIEAHNFYQHTLTLIAPTDRLHRWLALLGLNDVLARLGDTAAQKDNVEELVELAAGLEAAHRAEAIYRRCVYMDAAGNYRQAVLDCEAGLELARLTGNAALEVRLLAYNALFQNRLGNTLGAALAAQAALEHIVDVDEMTTARALVNVASYFVESGDLSRAVELHHEQVALTHRIGDRRSEANALINLGYDYVCLGLSAEARAVLEQAMKISQTIGAQRELLYVRLNLGLAHWRSGDLQIARHILEQVTIDLAASRDTFARAASLSYLALTLEQATEKANAVQYFREAQRQFETLGVRGYALDARAGLARCLTALGQMAEAQPDIESLWHDLCQHGAQGAEFAVWAYVTCAQVFEALGQTDHASAAIEAGYQELQARAAKISNAQWRASLLDNVPEHRTIMALWRQQAATASGL